MVGKMFKTSLLVAPLLMGAMAVPSIASSILIGGNQVNGVSPGDPTVSSVFFDPTIGTNAVIYSYEVDLTVGNELSTGDGFSSMSPLVGFVGGSEHFVGANGYNFSLTDTGSGGSIAGLYTGGANTFVLTQTMLGTLSFESTVAFDPGHPALVNYLSKDDNANGNANPSGESFLYGNVAGTPIPTPLPAGFGSGIAGLALVGLVSVKLRRKAAV
jgi:hypothetical protein